MTFGLSTLKREVIPIKNLIRIQSEADQLDKFDAKITSFDQIHPFPI